MGASSTVQSIVNSNCCTLLNTMQTGNPDADVGISVALYYPNDSSVPSFYRYGKAGPGIDITPETVYGIGSLTKVFTAALAAYLSATKSISLYDPVKPYLSNSKCNPSGVSGFYWDKVTFEQFATQMSGMPRDADGNYANQLFTDDPPCCQQLVWWNDNQTSFANNEGYWIYSNAGFVTLGFAVVAAWQKYGTGGYRELLEYAIADAIDMPNTFPANYVPADAVLAQGYNHQPSPVSITAAADLKSSAQDMLTWLDAVYQAMKLRASGASLTALQQALADTAKIWIPDPKTPPPNSKPKGFAMGLGWQIPTIGSAQVLVKDGLTSLGGCSCWVGLTQYDPAVPPVGIAIMTNQVKVLPDPTGHTILQEVIALGKPPSGRL